MLGYNNYKKATAFRRANPTLKRFSPHVVTTGMLLT